MDDVQPKQNQHMHVHHVGWMYIALVVISFLAVIGTGFGVYYLQQEQMDSLEKALSEKSVIKVADSKEVTSAATTAQFDRATAPFAFDYPANWVLLINQPMNSNDTLGNLQSYSLDLYAPASIDEETTIGGKDIKKGARIAIQASKTPYATMAEMKETQSFKAMTRDAIDVTFGGQPGLYYRMLWEATDSRVFSTIKNGWQYSVRLTTEGDETKSPSAKDFEALAKSFKFK